MYAVSVHLAGGHTVSFSCDDEAPLLALFDALHARLDSAEGGRDVMIELQTGSHGTPRSIAFARSALVAIEVTPPVHYQRASPPASPGPAPTAPAPAVRTTAVARLPGCLPDGPLAALRQAIEAGRPDDLDAAAGPVEQRLRALLPTVVGSLGLPPRPGLACRLSLRLLAGGDTLVPAADAPPPLLIGVLPLARVPDGSLRLFDATVVDGQAQGAAASFQDIPAAWNTLCCFPAGARHVILPAAAPWPALVVHVHGA